MSQLPQISVFKSEISWFRKALHFFFLYVSVEFCRMYVVLSQSYLVLLSVDSYPSQLLTSLSQKCSCDTTTSLTGFGVCLEIGFRAFFQFEYLVSSEAHVKFMCDLKTQ